MKLCLVVVLISCTHALLRAGEWEWRDSSLFAARATEQSGSAALRLSRLSLANATATVGTILEEVSDSLSKAAAVLNESDRNCFPIWEAAAANASALAADVSRLSATKLENEAKFAAQSAELRDLRRTEAQTKASHDASVVQRTRATLYYLDKYFDYIQQQETLVTVLELFRGRYGGMYNQSDKESVASDQILGIFTGMLENIHHWVLTEADNYRASDESMGKVIISQMAVLSEIDDRHEVNNEIAVAAQARALNAGKERELRQVAERAELDAKGKLMQLCGGQHGQLQKAVKYGEDALKNVRREVQQTQQAMVQVDVAAAGAKTRAEEQAAADDTAAKAAKGRADAASAAATAADTKEAADTAAAGAANTASEQAAAAAATAAQKATEDTSASETAAAEAATKKAASEAAAADAASKRSASEAAAGEAAAAEATHTTRAGEQTAASDRASAAKLAADAASQQASEAVAASSAADQKKAEEAAAYTAAQEASSQATAAEEAAARTNNTEEQQSTAAAAAAAREAAEAARVKKQEAHAAAATASAEATSAEEASRRAASELSTAGAAKQAADAAAGAAQTAMAAAETKAQEAAAAATTAESKAAEDQAAFGTAKETADAAAAAAKAATDSSTEAHEAAGGAAATATQTEAARVAAAAAAKAAEEASQAAATESTAADKTAASSEASRVAVTDFEAQHKLASFLQLREASSAMGSGAESAARRRRRPMPDVLKAMSMVLCHRNVSDSGSLSLQALKTCVDERVQETWAEFGHKQRTVTSAMLPTNSLAALSIAFGIQKAPGNTEVVKLADVKGSVERGSADLRSETSQILHVRSEARTARAEAWLNDQRAAAIELEVPLAESLKKSEVDASGKLATALEPLGGMTETLESELTGALGKLDGVDTTVAGYIEAAAALPDPAVHEAASAVPASLAEVRSAIKWLSANVVDSVKLVDQKGAGLQKLYADAESTLEAKVVNLTAERSTAEATASSANSTARQKESKEVFLLTQRNVTYERYEVVSQNATDVFDDAVMDKRVEASLGDLGELWKEH